VTDRAFAKKQTQSAVPRCIVVSALALLAMAGACASRSRASYLGEWRVISFMVPGVAALTQSDATNWVGTLAKYDEKTASFGDDTCASPSYATRTLTPEQFEQEYRIKPAALHLTDPQIALITVTCASSWTNRGSVLIVKSPDGLLTTWDGAFFELQRRLP
jgi:hypothetical protein